MPIWLTIVLACGGSAIITFLVNRFGDAILTFFSKKARAKKERKEAEARNKRITEIKEANRPLVEKIDEIDDRLKEDRSATILQLRVEMKNMRDAKVEHNRELDQGDISTWKELYRKYYEMGGNHFHEYVDGWGNEIGIPFEELKDIRDNTEQKK